MAIYDNVVQMCQSCLSKQSGAQKTGNDKRVIYIEPLKMSGSIWGKVKICHLELKRKSTQSGLFS